MSPTPTIGDLIRLKSGGPLITVVHVAQKTIKAVWFPNDSSPQEAWLPIDSIVLVAR